MTSSNNTNAVLRYGAYVCFAPAGPSAYALLDAPIPEVAERFGLENEFSAQDGHPLHALAFLRRIDATVRDVPDRGLMEAVAVVHVASDRAALVDEFCDAVRHLVDRTSITRVLQGVVRPPRYTGAAMHEFAYARQVTQQSGPVAPHAFLVPMMKTAEWWKKDWMARHTYFLPRFDDQGHMVSEGHALAAAAGIPCLMRRTYKNLAEPAPKGEYDFINYFECAQKNVQTFHSVCASLRDVARNPEWRFVREGATWHGERVATWRELFR